MDLKSGFLAMAGTLTMATGVHQAQAQAPAGEPVQKDVVYTFNDPKKTLDEKLTFVINAKQDTMSRGRCTCADFIINGSDTVGVTLQTPRTASVLLQEINDAGKLTADGKPSQDHLSLVASVINTTNEDMKRMKASGQLPADAAVRMTVSDDGNANNFNFPTEAEAKAAGGTQKMTFDSVSQAHYKKQVAKTLTFKP